VSWLKTLPYQAIPLYRAEDDYVSGLEIVVKATNPLELVRLTGDIINKIKSMGYSVLSVRLSEIFQEIAIIVIIVRRSGNKKSANIEEFIKEVSLIEGVLQVKHIERIKNVLYAELLFPPMVLNERVVLSGKASMEGLLVESRKQLGGVANIVIQRVGYFVGKRLHERYASPFLEEKKHSEIKNFLRLIFLTAGWGIIEGYDVGRDGSIIIAVSDLWEKWILDENGLPERPEYTIGVLQGFYEKLLGKPVEVTCTVDWKYNRELVLFFITPK
jgi:predicted hydrocarbon binding protein